MSNYASLSASNGSGEAIRANVQAPRTIGSTTISVNAITNWPTGSFIATTGTLQSDGTLKPTTVQVFFGTASGTNITITSFAPGYTDKGNATNDIVVIKPTTEWANQVSSFIKGATNNGTANDLWAANMTINNTLRVTGTSSVVAGSTSSSATITPSSQVYSVTALAVAATVATPSFTPQDGMGLMIRIKDNGTARALSFNSIYVDVTGIGLPTTTVAGKLLTLGAVYNSSSTKWEVQGINQQA